MKIDEETVTFVSAAETSNRIIATKTVTGMIATERSTNITVTERTTRIVATEPRNLHNCNRRYHLHNCYIHSSTETAACRTDYTQKLFLAEMVPVRGSFSYNKKLSKHQV